MKQITILAEKRIILIIIIDLSYGPRGITNVSKCLN